MDRVIYKQPDKRVKQEKEIVIMSLFNSSVAKVVLLGISVFLVYSIFHSVSITVQKVEILNKARVEVEDLRLRNLELASLLERMQTVEYLEVEARDRLNFTGKKEIVFVIPENMYPVAREYVDSLLSENEVDSSEYGLEVWKSFLFSGI